MIIKAHIIRVFIGKSAFIKEATKIPGERKTMKNKTNAINKPTIAPLLSLSSSILMYLAISERFISLTIKI